VRYRLITAFSFFDNKGAVAGTFTTVGVVVLAIAALVTRALIQRNRRLHEDMDDVYFEKYGEKEPSPMNDPEVGFGGPAMDSSMNVTTHAAADAYPSREVHYGADAYGMQADSRAPTGMQQGYEQAYDYHANGGPMLDYPPGTQPSFAPETYEQQHHVYNEYYNGQQESTSGQQEYYQPNSPSHPYSNPSNAAHNAGAPPVTGY
jgi:hypothetical protein